jgi:NAD(P)-dependent dehydrogenase (short-subunit alcohol dehydrogenase family)
MVDSRTPSPDRLFDLSGRVAVVTGATGVLGGAMARGLARAGARVSVLGRRKERAEEVAAEVKSRGGEALALPADVLKREQLEAARDAVLERWGRVDILVNAAGGNVPAATVGEDATFFGLPEEPLREVFDLNLLGTVLPSQVFGETMTGDQSSEAEGSIVNVSSMAAQKPLTRVVGYSAAKAAVENLTRWLAVELAHKYGPGLRVNAIAPGFFLGEQNRALLMHEDGRLTERGQAIVEHTPARRFGEPEELVGTLIWLCSPAARFVTGVVVPVDGGFGAFSGV